MLQRTFSLIRILTIILFVACISVSSFGQTFSGPPNVYTNAVYTYYYNNSTVYEDGYIDAVNGTVLSNTLNGTFYYATIVWGSAGSGTVKFYNGPRVLGTLNVTITYAPPTPSATISSTNNCGSTTITRSNNPSSGTDWYWQTSPTGTSTALGNADAVNITTNGTTLYLRARQTAAPNTWSVSSQSIGAVTVYSTIPDPPSTNSAISRCGPGPVSLTATAGTNGNQVKWYAASTGGSPLAANGSYTPTVNATTMYYVVSAIEGNACESTPRTAVNVTIDNDIPHAPLVTGNARFGLGALTLTASGAPGGGTYQWYNSSNTLQSSIATWVTPAISSTTANYGYATVTSSSNCVSAPTWVTASVYPVPVITASQNYFGRGATVTLDAGPGYDSYLWRNGLGQQVFFSNTIPPVTNYIAPAADTYSVTVTKNGITSSPATFVLGTQLSGENMNYVVTNTAMTGNITDLSVVDNLPIEQVNQSIQYFDGLGRPVQTVITQGSPMKNDIVQPVVYDAFGRENKKYLPFTAQANGLYKSNVIDENGNYSSVALNYYNSGPTDKITDDTRPFTETIFEASPLNRPVQQFGPGQNWADNNKAVSHQYLVNQSNEVVLFSYDAATGMVSGKVGEQVQYYDAGQLHANVTTDEHNNNVIEYVDKLGHTICKKVQYGSDATGKLFASTYYIYDDLGNLTVVLPPEGVKTFTN